MMIPRVLMTIVSVAPPASSESLLEGPQVHLVCPGAAGLFMQMPVGVGNGIRIQQPVLTGLLDMFGRDAPQPFAIDTPVNNNMRNMYAAGSIFASSALSYGAQSCLGRGEGDERAPTANRRGCAGQQETAAA